VTADAEGRLSFAVDMGRRSAGQQYRAPSEVMTVVNQVQLKIQRL
jgi:hypothetical protein